MPNRYTSCVPGRQHHTPLIKTHDPCASRSDRILLIIILLALSFAAPWPGHAQALEPVDPAAGPEARALLELLDRLPERLDGRVMSGQTIHGDLEAQYEKYIEGYYRTTGVYPALLQLMLYAHWLEDREHFISHRSDAAIFPLSYNHANAGGVVMWLYNPNNPFTGQGNKTAIPDGHLLHEVYTDTTAANEVWHEDLRMMALQARRLERAGIPVIVRMFGEYNNRSLRWQSVRMNPLSTWEEFKAAWRFAVSAVASADAHNLLWCLEEAETPAYRSKYSLLGWQEDWIDINGMQAVFDNNSRGPLNSYANFLNVSRKPVLFGQYLLSAELYRNPSSYRYDHAIDLVRESMPEITAIVPWSVHEWGSPEDLREHSPVFHLAAAEYTLDPWMINRGEIETGFADPGRAPLPIRREPLAVAGAYAWNFDERDAPAWSPAGNGSIQNLSRADGLLNVFFFGNDPVLKRSRMEMPARFGRLRLRLRNNSLAESVTLSWKRTTDTDWSPERQLSIPVEAMGVYLEERRVDLSDHPSWTGTIDSVRLNLNPVGRWGSAEIDFVKFGDLGGESAPGLLNRGFEGSLGVGWQPRQRGAAATGLARYDREHRSGDYAGLIYLRDHRGDGIRQDVTSVLRKRGPGSYRFGGYLKLPDTMGPDAGSIGRIALVIKSDGERTVHRAREGLSTAAWRLLEERADLHWDGELERATLIINATDSSHDLLVDDLFLKTPGK